jgi:hypothetical protein
MLAAGSLGSWGLTSNDVDGAELRSCIGCIKGKDSIIHREQHPTERATMVGTHFHCDVAYVYQLRFLIAVENVTGFTVRVPIDNRSTDSLFAAMCAVRDFYVNLGWAGEKVFHWDREAGSIAAVPRLRREGIDVRHTAAHQHEKRAENATKLIHNLMRSTFRAHLYDLPI